MGRNPRIPHDYELVEQTNGWQYEHNSSYNARTWYSEDQRYAVRVSEVFGDVRVDVVDRRAGAAQEIYRKEIEGLDRKGFRSELEQIKAEAVAEGIDVAVEWMRSYAPSEYAHPEVSESIFDPPAGFLVDHCDHSSRTITIWYRQEDMEPTQRLAGIGMPDEHTLETCPYLYIRIWRGSGNADICLAPWFGAHDRTDKYNEMESVVDAPDECGLERALTLARGWVREQRGLDEGATTRQVDFDQFAQT